MASRSITWKTLSTLAVATALTVGTAGMAPTAQAAAGAGAHAKKVEDATPIEAIWGDDDTKEGRAASRATGTWDASADLGSMFSTARAVGAQAAWAGGVTGKDVTVAVIDTGIAPVRGLDGPDKVVDGPDLSYEGQSANTQYVDGYGHGTHMAGIIAGRDDKVDPKKPSAAQFSGIAPDARLLNMKVATGDGGADVTQVIAALDWVVQHQDDQGMHVRVVNLAYGTATVQPWQVDPLAHAVESAWNHGIVVVTAAGNDGLDESRLLMPAADPHVIAVGAVDHVGTEGAADDEVADFTNGGGAARRPDVLAPGKSVVSLRVPGSWIDTEHPEGLVRGDAAARFFRGSGTSQATAVVSGEVALLLDANPKLTPDQVKQLLMDTAAPLRDNPQPAMGSGVADVKAALAAIKLKLPLLGQPARPASSGTGSIEATRGGEHVVDPSTGVQLDGERDALGAPWDATTWAARSSAGTAWTKGVFNGRTWAGDRWKDRRLVPAVWSGDSWSGSPWSTHEWSDAEWQARGWRARGWRARGWRSETWLARGWRGMD